MKPLTGRTAIVTGSGRNLGRGIALGFAQAGANVVLNGHGDLAALESVAKEIEALGAQAICVLADVSQPEQVMQMAESTLQRFGSIDIAVSNVANEPDFKSGNFFSAEREGGGGRKLERRRSGTEP